MEDGMTKINEKGTKKTKVLNVTLIIIMILCLCAICLIFLPKLLKPNSLTIEGENVQYQQVWSEEDFIDSVAWIDANGYVISNNSYPEKVFYYDAGNACSKTFENFDDYLDFLIEVKYSDTLELHKLSIPKYVVYQ